MLLTLEYFSFLNFQILLHDRTFDNGRHDVDGNTS